MEKYRDLILMFHHNFDIFLVLLDALSQILQELIILIDIKPKDVILIEDIEII